MRGRGRPGVVVIALLLAASLAHAQHPSPAAFGALTAQLAGLFPKLDGEIVEVRGALLTLSVGRRDGLQSGVELLIVREGRELKHPQTGQALGRVEEPVGRAVVAEVFEAYALARPEAATAPRPGDRVRVSAGTISLLVVPLVSGVKDSQAEAVIQQLMDELNRSDRFRAISGDALAVRLAEQGIAPEQVFEGRGLEHAVRRPGADYLLAVLVKRVQRKPYLEARLFSGTRPMLTSAMFVPSAVKAQPRGQFSADPKPATPSSSKPRSLLARLLGLEAEAGAFSAGESSIKLREVGRFAVPILSMDVSASPGDRVPRVVLTDGSRIHLYRVATEGLQPEWTYWAGSIGQVFSVQLADLDGDGVLEVVANRFHPQEGIGLTSLILATRDGRPHVVAEEGKHVLLAVDSTGTGIKDALWEQPFTPDGFYARGQAEAYALRNGALVRQRRVIVPHDFRATGAAMTNVTGKDGGRALVYVDSQNRLAIAVDRDERWRSTARVGGGGHLKLEVLRHSQLTTRSTLYAAEPMPLAVDLDGDGIDEILVPQNQVEGRLAVVFRGPAGFRMQSIDTGFEGIMTALGSYRLEEDTGPTLFAAVVRFDGLLKRSGETQVLMARPD